MGIKTSNQSYYLVFHDLQEEPALSCAFSLSNNLTKKGNETIDLWAFSTRFQGCKGLRNEQG